MKRALIFVLLLFTLNNSFAKQRYSNKEIRRITDSILVEGNLLYQYERAAWEATDRGNEREDIRESLYSYLVYDSSDTIRVCLLNKNIECIADFSFVGSEGILQDINFDIRSLTEKELRLFLTRAAIVNQIVEKQLPVVQYDNFSLNFILLPHGEKFKLYILSGTSLNNVIPLGNDYVFFADKDANITAWRKMHSRLIADDIADLGKITEIIHSHLIEEPFITPTDICTFRLYGPLFGIKKFSIYSTALRKYFTYDEETKTIAIRDSSKK